MCDCSENNNEYLLCARYSSEGIVCSKLFKSHSGLKWLILTIIIPILQVRKWAQIK